MKTQKIIIKKRRGRSVVKANTTHYSFRTNNGVLIEGKADRLFFRCLLLRFLVSMCRKANARANKLIDRMERKVEERERGAAMSNCRREPERILVLGTNKSA